MNRLFFLIGLGLCWSAIAGPLPEIVFENGFENDPNAVEILSFNANPDIITIGDSTTLEWTLKDATACVPSDGTVEWQALDLSTPGVGGDFEVTNLGLGLHSFTLTCTGPIGDPSVAVRQILVEDLPPECEDPELIGSTVTWPFFWQAEFPEIDLGLAPGGEPKDFNELPTFPPGYSAIEFHTADVVATGLFESPDNIFVSGERIGVVSRCEGRFDNVSAACKFVWDTNEGGITWSTEGTVGACQLDADSTYYLNITFTDGEDPTTTTCDQNEDCYPTIKHTLIP